MYEVHADVRYAVRSCLINLHRQSILYAPGLLRVPRHPNGVVFITLLVICQNPLKCYSVLPSFSRHQGLSTNLKRNGWGGLEQCR
jgi:hypothetical protein